MSSPFLPAWPLEQAQRRPEAPAVATPSARLSYGELATRVERLAGALAASGVRPGDRVLVALPNLLATVVAGLAVQRAGAVAVEVNREWSAEILAGIVARSGVRQALVWGRDARTWGRVLALAPLDRLWLVHGGPPPPALLAELARHALGHPAGGRPARPGPGRPAAGAAARLAERRRRRSSSTPRGAPGRRAA